MKRSEKAHHPLDYFQHAAEFFHGIDRIHCTGGEPSLHPGFVNLVPQLRSMFSCRLLTIESNGYGFTKFPETFRHFDIVYCSEYTKDSFDGCPDNREKIDHLRTYFNGTGPEIIVGKIDFVPRTTKGTKPCHRAYSETVAYAGGLLYPCCVGPGLPVKRGIPLTETWRDDILKIHPPCDGCFFAE